MLRLDSNGLCVCVREKWLIPALHKLLSYQCLSIMIRLGLIESFRLVWFSLCTNWACCSIMAAVIEFWLAD